MRAAAWLPAFLLAASPVLAQPAAPLAATRVEPPSWWVGHSLNPVRVLIKGSGLNGAAVKVGGAGVSAANPRASASGSWLFLDLTIDPEALPGPRTLELRKGGRVARLTFDLLSPLPRAGRFRGFSPDDVIYLVMPDRFADGDRANDDPAKARGLFDRSKARYYHGGDLQGVIDHLDYIKELGATALWLTPVYDNSDRLNERETYEGQGIADYHGYGAVDFYAVDEHLGTVALYRELVDRAHALGLKVIQDQVANHTGPAHPWVKDPPTPTWFNGTVQNHEKNTWQAWTLADTYGTPETRASTLGGWFIDILPDLDQDDPETARYLIQNSLWWVGQTGLDAIRQDTLPYVPRAYWRDWTAALGREYPDLTVLGELWDGDPALVSYYQKGARGMDGIDTGVHSLFDFPLFYAVRRAFTGQGPLRDVVMMLGRDRLYPNPGWLVPFLGLHDVPRFLGEPGATAAGLRQAFTFLCTTRGIPLVYYGDELAMRGGGDPENRRDFPGGFPGDPASAFTPAGRTGEAAEVHDHVQKLLALRAQLSPLRRGRIVNLQIAEQSWAFARRDGGASVVVAFNNGSEPAVFDLAAGAAGLGEGAVLQDRLGAAGALTVSGGRLRFTLPPQTSAILVP